MVLRKRKREDESKWERRQEEVPATAYSYLPTLYLLEKTATCQARVGRHSRE